MLRSVILGGLFVSMSMCVDPVPGDGDGDGDGDDQGDGDADIDGGDDDDDGDGDDDDTGDGDGDCPPACEQNDDFEPNDTPDTATLIPWDNISEGESGLAYSNLDLFLCAGEHDWFVLSVEELDFSYYALHLDGLVMGTSWCPFEDCNSPSLPDAFENTLAFEVFDLATGVLLASDISTSGRVDINGFGPSFSNDLLIHVHGLSPAATYAYELAVQIRGFDGEDECEC